MNLDLAALAADPELAEKLERARSLLRSPDERLYLSGRRVIGWLLPDLSPPFRGRTAFWVTRDQAGLQLREMGWPRWWEQATGLPPSVPAAAPDTPSSFWGARIVVAGGTRRHLDPRELRLIRSPLLPAEVERYRQLGAAAALAVTHALFHLRPGQTDHQLAALMGEVLLGLGVQVDGWLIAVDGFPPRRLCGPLGRRVTRRATLGFEGCRQGLHIACARSVMFGEGEEHPTDAGGFVRSAAIDPYSGWRAEGGAATLRSIERPGAFALDTLLNMGEAELCLTATRDLPSFPTPNEPAGLPGVIRR